MKTIAICCLVALAVVCTIAILPGSSWVFRNQVDLLTSQRSHDFDGNQDLMEVFMPLWLTDPQTYRGSDPSTLLMRALLLPFDQRNEALEQYTKEHPADPMALAVMARMACMMGARSPDNPDKEDDVAKKKGDLLLTVGRDASVKGEALEPNNAFFPLMRASFDVELNRLDDLSAALASAAAKPSFDSHVIDESQEMEKALILAKGYRGELVRMGTDATLMFPELSHVKSMARYLNRHGSLQQKRDLIQTEYTISRDGETAISFLVAIASVRLVIHDDVNIHPIGITKLTDSKWLQLAGDFDAKLRAANIPLPSPPTPEIVQRYSRLVAAFQKYIDKISTVLQEDGGGPSGGKLGFFSGGHPHSSPRFPDLHSSFFRLSRGASREFNRRRPRECFPICSSCRAGSWPCQCPGTVLESNAPEAGATLGVAQLILACLYLGKNADAPTWFAKKSRVFLGVHPRTHDCYEFPIRF